MNNSEELESFLEKVDSIQRRFLESLITGQRDPIFRESKTTPIPETEHTANQVMTTELAR